MLLLLAALVAIGWDLGNWYGLGCVLLGVLATSPSLLALGQTCAVADTARGIEQAVGSVRPETAALHRLGVVAGVSVRQCALLTSGLIVLAGLFVLEQSLAAYGVNPDVLRTDLLSGSLLLGLLAGGSLGYGVQWYLFRAIRRIVGGLERPHHRLLALAAKQHATVPLVATLSVPLIVGCVAGPAAVVGTLAGALLTALPLASQANIAGSLWHSLRHATPRSDALRQANMLGDALKDVLAPTVPSMLVALLLVSLMSVAIFV